MNVVVADPALLVAVSTYNPPSEDRSMSVRVNVDVALGGSRSLFSIVTLSVPLTNVAPSCVQVMLVKTRLSSTVTISSRVSPSTTLTFSPEDVVGVTGIYIL